jgi:hypothetical protein
MSSCSERVLKVLRRSYQDRTQLPGMHDFGPHSTRHLQKMPPPVPSRRHRVGLTPMPTPSDHLASTSRNCLRKAISYLHQAQQPHGGWIGSWGICFTHAAQLALESLSLVGETYEISEYSREGCEFLLKHQREVGGWGESWEVRFFFHCCSREKIADCDGTSLALRMSGLRRRRRKPFKLPGRPWVSCTPNIPTPSPSRGPSSWSC